MPPGGDSGSLLRMADTRTGHPPAPPMPSLTVLARRAALALTAFELVLFALSPDAWLEGGFWAWVAILSTPLTFFSLVFLGIRILPAGLARRRLILGYLLLQYGVQAFYNRMLLTEPGGLLAFATATAAGGLLLWGRIPGQAPLLRVLVPVSWGLTAVSLPFWLLAEPAVRQLAPPPVPGKGPDLLLVTLDTVRADVLPAWGGTGIETPNLDRLLREGFLYEDAVASTPITGPSHATMLTGLLPPSHGVRANLTHTLASGLQTLPALLREAGYETGGFVAAYPLLGRLGFDRGFQVYDDRLAAGGLERVRDLGRRNFVWALLATRFLGTRGEAALDGSVVNRRALRWLAQRDGRYPVFLWVHYYDAHGPHEPPEPWRGRALAQGEEARPAPVEPALGREMALYRAEIEEVDAYLGEVLAAQEERDPGLRNTLVVVTADHGECFGEGGIELNHVGSLYEATQHVPLIIRPPGGVPGGVRIRRTVGHEDLMPTFLHAAGLEVPENLRGLDLLGEGPESLPPARPIYLESWQERHNDRGLELRRGLRDTDWKLVREMDGPVFLWRFRENEQENLVERFPEQRARLEQALEELLASIPDAGDTSRRDLSGAELQALDQLGYGDGNP